MDISIDSSTKKWKAVGTVNQRKDEKKHLGVFQPKQTKQTKQRSVSIRFTPSKQKNQLYPKIFQQALARNQSQIISKDDLRLSGIRQTSNPQNRSFCRVSQSSVKQGKKLTPVQISIKKPNQKNDKIKDNQLNALKQDYLKFKQKILIELQIQKQSLTKMFKQILKNVQQKVSEIQRKLANKQQNQRISQISRIQRISFQLNPDSEKSINILRNNIRLQSLASNNNITIQQRPSQQVISSLSKRQNQNQNQKQTINIPDRFNRFQQVIQKLKQQLDGLHQINSINDYRIKQFQTFRKITQKQLNTINKNQIQKDYEFSLT